MSGYPPVVPRGLRPPATPGRTLREVPDLLGLSIADACEAAAWAGTRLNATAVSRPHGPWGVVIAQSPSPGMRLEPRWQVHVLVAVLPVAHDAEETDGE